MQSAWQLVHAAAERTPDARAVVDRAAGTAWSYRELVDGAERLAGGLHAAGVQPRMRVATVLPNTLDHVLTLLALARLDAQTVLVSPRLKPPEIADIVERCEARAAVIDEGVPGDALGPGVRLFSTGGHAGTPLDACRSAASAPATTPRGEDGAYVFLTSGTTGRPKAVLTPHRATEPRVLFMCAQAGLRHGPHNRLIGLMPLSHNIGFYAVMIAALALNGTYYPFRGFDPGATLDAIEAEGISCVFASPTHYHALVRHPAFAPERVRSVANVVYAGAAMPEAVLEEVSAGFSGLLVQIYGTTETMNSLYMPDPRGRPHTLRPGLWSRVRVAPLTGEAGRSLPPGEEGEIVIDASADATFLEYVGDPAETARRVAGGWYRTGDAGCLDAEGNVVLRGRLDDMIITGAENVHPVEVEAVLATCPGVRDVAVFGLPDERWGERVAAAVVADPPVTAAGLDEHCRASALADFKRPRDYLLVDELPRNATGKVQRSVLQERALRA
jgi:acyl-CoA synthetase (AMP-forming)/AMP-acid ligase II